MLRAFFVGFGRGTLPGVQRSVARWHRMGPVTVPVPMTPVSRRSYSAIVSRSDSSGGMRREILKVSTDSSGVARKACNVYHNT